DADSLECALGGHPGLYACVDAYRSELRIDLEGDAVAVLEFLCDTGERLVVKGQPAGQPTGNGIHPGRGGGCGLLAQGSGTRLTRFEFDRADRGLEGYQPLRYGHGSTAVAGVNVEL